jgi:myo-inositol 2-dehydrogenase / D-chiro-inositol 1-dehydrogenase
MSKNIIPRLRHFEQSSSQQHMSEADRYLSKLPSPTHNFVIIGTGTIGKEHMRVTHLLGRARVHGIFDTRKESADIAEREFAEISSEKLVRYSDLDTALEDPAVDAYFICTPNYTHYEVLCSVIKTGKPIFVEKPMATTVPDSVKMVEMVNEYSNFIQIGLQYRYKSQYQEAFHEALVRKTLGEVKTISVSEYRPPFLDKIGQWNKFSEYSGGTLVEKCCHYFDLINLMAESEPERVFASGGQAVNFRDFEKDGRASDIDDNAFVIIEYKNGIRANFTLNMFCADFDEEMIVVGEHGRLVAREKACFQQQKPPCSTIAVELGEQGASRVLEVNYPRIIEASGHHGATFYEHQKFMDQIEGKPADCATAEQGLWAVVVAAAAQDSIATGNPILIASFLVEKGLGHLLA